MKNVVARDSPGASPNDDASVDAAERSPTSPPEGRPLGTTLSSSTFEDDNEEDGGRSNGNDEGPSSSPPLSSSNKRAKSGDDSDKLEEEHKLLDKKLASDDDNDNVEALKTLSYYFNGEDYVGPDQARDLVRLRWSQWSLDKKHGPVVMKLLKQKLYKCERDATGGRGDPPTSTRNVVYHALSFLVSWFYRGSKSCRDVLTDLDGVRDVLRAMRTFPHDPAIQYSAINGLIHFSDNLCRDDDRSQGPRRRRQQLVKAGAVLTVFGAITATYPNKNPSTNNAALYVLDLLFDDATSDDVKALNDRGAIMTFAGAWDREYYFHHPTCPRFHEMNTVSSCRKWISKLTAPS